ncbi:hypothetical protein LTR08_005758 [Meristemomyces frigidus]|nr:hypothetical protein LTR08_005758 [Meristemomyces frigidus]
MTFFFAGRFTLRRLHQTVHRNISRQHQARYESSKQSPNPARNGKTSANEAPKQRTIPGPAWAWIEPLAIPLKAYGNMQKRSPILTQLESTLVVYWLGDLSAQLVQSGAFKDAPYEPARGLRALFIGLTISIPSYKWFLFLGRHFNYGSHLVSIGVKIVVNQMVFTPLFNTYFFGMQSLLSGSTFAEAKRRVIATVPTSWKNSWKVWPIVTAISFTFIPPESRAVFAGVIAIFWQTYLSWLNTSAEALEMEEVGEPKEAKNRADKATKVVQAAKT